MMNGPEIQKLLDAARLDANNEQYGTAQHAFIMGKINAYEKVLFAMSPNNREKLEKLYDEFLIGLREDSGKWY